MKTSPLIFTKTLETNNFHHHVNFDYHRPTLKAIEIKKRPLNYQIQRTLYTCYHLNLCISHEIHLDKYSAKLIPCPYNGGNRLTLTYARINTLETIFKITSTCLFSPTKDSLFNVFIIFTFLINSFNLLL